MNSSNITFDFIDNPIYSIAYKVSGVLATICGLTSMFLILRNSPNIFGYYKYFLFNIAFWSFVFDMHMTSKNIYLATGCLFGLHIFYGCIISAITVAFFYRYYAVNRLINQFLSKRNIVLIILLHIFYNSIPLASYLVAAENRFEITQLIIQEYPNVKFYIENLGCVMLHPEISRPSSLVHVCISIFCFTISIPVVSTLIYKTIYALKENQQYMSAESYRMHRQMLKTLIFQLLIPTCTIILPLTTAIVLWYSSSEGVPQSAVQSGFILATTHSFTNTMMMLYFFPVYRIALIEKIRSLQQRLISILSISFCKLHQYCLQ
ncbi:hypothetical protein FO519_001853 [Halicephalobus sp. NKZ332]|nr:hypothetical protein FO519_001853 [Halicephalobus sp. NKZ332]